MKMSKRILIGAFLVFAVAAVTARAQDMGGQQNTGTSGQQSAQAQSPQSAGDIVETATKAGKFTILVKALEAAGLTETLRGQGPYTVFAPTDEAFAKLPAGTLESLLKPENKEQLRAILLYHVVPGRVTSSEVAKMTEAKTAQGETLRIRASDGAVKVDDATVTQADIAASNGVIHIIDSVLLPKGASKAQPKTY